MRVIAGSARSIALRTVAGTETRPTTDKIKETLFNILNFDLPYARFLDIFAGSGGIGIEALSRGAKEAVFIEKNRQAGECIKENLWKTKLADSARIMVSDANSAIQKLSMTEKESFDIIFMDPPYNKGLEFELLDILKDSILVDRSSMIIIEMDKTTDITGIDTNIWELTREKVYKNNKHIFLKRV